MNGTVLDDRLMSSADLVRQDAVFADIGTDHAHLPLFLLESGRISFAYMTDVAAGPLARARENARGSLHASKMEFLLTDGLSGLAGRGITDIAICGMGGELIADILNAASFIRSPAVHLILQPMTRQEHLRAFLAKEGFEVLKERYSHADGKYYVTLLARYTGTPYSIGMTEAYLGRLTEGECTEAMRGYLLKKRASLQKSVGGRRHSGADTAELDGVIVEIDRILKGEKI